MPDKKKSKESQNIGIQHENVLQAVVVTDSFDSRFLPVAIDRPKCLLPVANQPLLSYTLEFLASCGVKLIYVYSCHCADQVKKFLESSKWNCSSSPCIVKPVVSADLSSIGDVLRDVDQKSLFESDFLFVPGDIISNVLLKDALEEHKIRREKDKNKPLMTLIMQKLFPLHHSRSAENDVVIASDKISNRVLHYHHFSSFSKKINIPLSIFHSNSNTVEVRYDLLDTGIWICSPQVPPLFSDNFDYQTQFDFIKGILINEEFLGNQIHMHVINSRYCSRVHNFYMYDTVSRDVISRWTYPFVPEILFKNPSLQKDDCRYQLLRHNVYLASSCTLGHNSIVSNNSLIGADTVVGNDCRITDSVIGQGCNIENGSEISGSYIWNNVTIKKNCSIVNSILCDGVSVFEDVSLEKGCILCNKVSIGPSISLPTETVLWLPSHDGNDGFEDDEIKSTDESAPIKLFGSKGRGIEWKPECDDIDGGDGLTQKLWGLSLQEHTQLVDDKHEISSSDASSIMTSDAEKSMVESDDVGLVDDDVTNFQREVKESLLGGYNDKSQCDNLILEVNSSKYAYNVSMDEVVKTVTKSLFEIAAIDQNNSYFISLKKVLLFFLALLRNYNKTLSSQLSCLYAIEEHAASHDNVATCLVKILMLLYEEDVLSEQAILKWNDKPDVSYLAVFTPGEIRTKVSKFIQWLVEAEEESSDD